MQLFITLQKDVENIDQAKQLTDQIRQKLTDHPEITITSQINETITTQQ